MGSWYPKAQNSPKALYSMVLGAKRALTPNPKLRKSLGFREYGLAEGFSEADSQNL